ncbi:M20/M25/M40 family metallo-hydrolase [Undibacterium squillarum]|uniref:Aminopeptidase n=1 Tax=Undibacterium squillarum TaxID=1131567 RepID=A0ABQ2XY09_9BURK|nr:M20/M25/M40 family metallo-hydrolase [Undibacterium squillarum]GGX41685.1 aminopeptidase [Undibacterium squillarum]
MYGAGQGNQLRSLFFGLCLFTGSLSVSAQEVAEQQQTPAMRDLYHLSSLQMAGRKTGSAGSELARQYLISRLSEAGWKPCGEQWEQRFQFQANGQQLTGTNVLACLSPLPADQQLIVLSAHYDHLGAHHERIFFGADDNASGVAASLEIAARLKQTPAQHPVVLAFFDAEEMGLRGSHMFVKDNPELIRQTALNINLDMVGRADKDELYVAGTHHTQALKDVVQAIPANPALRLIAGHDLPGTGQDDWTSQSDHFAFHRAGIPFLYFGVEDHADYHQPGDVAEKIQPARFMAVINLIEQALRQADQRLSSLPVRQSPVAAAGSAAATH